VQVDGLERLETAEGAWLVHRRREPGRTAREILPVVTREVLDRLPIPKRMRWGSGAAEFVRPVHWVVMLHGADVVESEILGVRTGRHTRGHRFLCAKPLALASPLDYTEALATEGRVIADFGVRRERIRADIERTSAALGARALVHPDLLDEVTALTEWPVAIAARFDADFLRLPREVLISTLQGHQRYFPLVDAGDRLQPAFITIANIDSRAPERVREGNERVVHPRLTDAAFFWDTDRRRPLADRIEELQSVVYHERLGSLYDKSARVATLARLVAEQVGADPAQAQRAGWLSRCDLLTALVGEFPELQGVMGRYYAAATETPEVAAALDEMYMPRHAGDRLPATATGRALAIADKIDTIVGGFGIGQAPSGDKDPYGLRRATLGIIRIVLDGGLNLDLEELIGWARAGFGARLSNSDVEVPVLDFMLERLRNHYTDSGSAPDTFEAVLARRPTRPCDFDRRMRAVTAFRALPAASGLAAANKRIANILRKSETAPAARVDAGLLSEPAERTLATATAAVTATVDIAVAHGDYARALTQLAGLREPVDAFFDEVLVNCDDAAVRANRLALLEQLRRQFLQIADVGRLQS
jgi:glycyl-tRNA synthetase beta chain